MEVEASSEPISIWAFYEISFVEKSRIRVHRHIDSNHPNGRAETVAPMGRELGRLAHRQPQPGYPKLAVLWPLQEHEIRNNIGGQHPQAIDDVSCFVEAAHMCIASGEDAIGLRKGWVFLHRLPQALHRVVETPS